MKTKHLDVILIGVLLATVVSSFAFSWQRVNGLPTYGAVGMSADGRIICAVPSTGVGHVSLDSGKTWNFTGGPSVGVLYSSELAMSADGAKIFTLLQTNSGVRLCKSTDQGSSWTLTAFPGTQYFSNSPVACSGDGSIVIAAPGIGPIYYSADGGDSRSTSSVPNAVWRSLACSADARRMAAAADKGSVYFSTDFGATWSPTNLPAQSWNSICVSSDGKWVGAASATNSYISGDWGVTWRTNGIPGLDIICSADGAKWLIAGAQVFTSSDSGATWQTNFDASTTWNAAAMSADGSEVVAMGAASGFWLGRDIPSPLLNLSSGNSTVTLSWLVPSTNFVLQQNADLTGSWVTVPTSPALILTNLQQQIILPATTTNAFFRLIAQ